MPRKAFIASSLVLAGICAVAIVRAQDSTRTLFSGDAPTARTSYTAGDTAPKSPTQLETTLQSVSQSVAAEYGSDNESSRRTAPPPGELPDYLDAQRPLADVPGYVNREATQSAEPMPLINETMLAADNPSPAAPFRLTDDLQPARAASLYGDSTSLSGTQSVLKRAGAATPERDETPRVAERTMPQPLRDPLPTPSVSTVPTSRVPATAPPITPVPSHSTLERIGDHDPDYPMSSRRTQRTMTSSPPSSQSMTSTQNAIGMLTASQCALVRVETSGPSAIIIGKTASFTITVLNQSDVAARDVHIRVGLPAWVQMNSAEPSVGVTRKQPDAGGQDQLVWTLERLEGRGRQQLTLQVTPTENRAFELAVDWTVMPISAIAQIQVQQPELEVALGGPKDLLHGQSEKFTITVSNPGTGLAENVTVQLATGESFGQPHRIGPIPAGQHRQIEVEISAQQAGQLELTALASGDNGLKAQTARTIQVRQAKLEVEIAGPPLKFAGTAATYQVRVSNVGDAQVDGVIANVALPTGAKYLPSNEGPQPDAERLSWSLGTLRPGGDVVFLVNCQLLTAGENRLQVQARGGSNVTAAKVVATRVEAVADLKLLVNDPKGPKPIGEDVVYEIEITNRGTKAAEQVNVIAQFSEGIEPVRVEGYRAELVPGQVLFDPIPRIEAGQKITLKVTAQASAEGTHRFRAEVTSGDAETKLAAEDSTRYYKLDTPTLGAKPTANRY